MSTAVIEKSKLKGEIEIVPSKSYAHRILICAAFCSKPTVIKGIINSEDMLATLGCLKALGAGVEELPDDSCLITPVFRVKTAILNCRESGSTLRFLLPVAAALGGEFTFTGSGRLSERPNGELLSVLKSNGVEIKGSGLPVTLKGRISGEYFKIDGGISSQYITGLLLATPLIGSDVKIEITGELKSANYVNITLDVMKIFGIDVKTYGNCFFIKGGQCYRTPEEIKVEGDWSNAAFFLAGGLLCGRVKVHGLNPFSRQGDRAVLEIINKLGGNVKYEKGAYIAQKSDLIGCDFCVENIIDAAPVLSVLCAFAKGESKISGVERLKLKESDRLGAIIEILKALGVRAEYESGVLIINGGEPHGGVIDGKNDHRIVMSAVIAGAAVGGVKINGIEAVNKSYPSFFKDFLLAGGIYHAEN